MKNNDLKLEKSNLETNIKTSLIFGIFVSSLISAFSIIIVKNLNINFYFKTIIFPCSVLLINYRVIMSVAKYEINKKAYIWLLPIILILISDILLPVDFSNLVLNVFILPLLITNFFLALINDNYYLSRNFMKWVFKLFPSGLFSNLKYLNSIYANKVKDKNKKALNIVLGACVGIPIAIIILSLLASADKYFSVFMSSITKVFSSFLRMDLIVQNIFMFLVSFLICYSVLINVIKHKNTKNSGLKYYNVNYDISKTLLIIVNAVFVLFLISEISKITINFLSLPTQYTYAEYAREGFFQLLFVTAINFSIILFYIYYVKNSLENKTVKRLLLTLIAFSILLIFNSYYRMFLYIGNYGFTILRLQVILFLLMELILFIIMIKKMIFKLKHSDAKIFSTTFIVTYILNIYFCI